MKKYSLAFFGLSVLLIVFFSCTKINEPTTLGGDLIPAVDNVNTFEVALNTITSNRLLDDSVRVGYNDPLALGHVDDPEFGSVDASLAFSLSSPATYGFYPFASKIDSLAAVDSVVLQLAYGGAYGDTLANGVQTIQVMEIPAGTFRSDTSYRYNDPASVPNGAVLGTKTYTIRNLDDSIWVKEPTDTAITKRNNVVRIRLNNSLGEKLVDLDTGFTQPQPGYYSDSAFKKFFPGLSIKATSGGNSLAYFNLYDQTNTKLTVYYRYKRNGRDTTAAVSFLHSGFGQSNYVNVQKGGNWNASIGTPNASLLYLQSAPSPSYVHIVIPDLQNFANKVIHRAEIIAERVPSASDNIFTPPHRLFLDRLHSGSLDSGFIFPIDLPVNLTDNSVDFSIFDGTLKSNAYHFNISRYVQGIITRHDRSDTLRMYAPLRTISWDPSYITAATPKGAYQVLSIGQRVLEGRVVLAGSGYVNPAQRLRLRIIYSNL